MLTLSNPNLPKVNLNIVLMLTGGGGGEDDAVCEEGGGMMAIKPSCSQLEEMLWKEWEGRTR